jgi:hypothetical protein
MVWKISKKLTKRPLGEEGVNLLYDLPRYTWNKYPRRLDQQSRHIYKANKGSNLGLLTTFS